MSVLIFCTGESVNKISGLLDSRGFEAAVKKERDSEIIPFEGKKTDPKDRAVLIGEGLQAKDTAEKILLQCRLTVEPLLNEIPLHAFTDTEKQYKPEVWLRKAAAQRKAGNPQQEESLAEVRKRADMLIAKMEKLNPILIVYPLFLEVLIDRLRAKGYVVQRSGMLKIQPLERFVASRREEHCGGCQHNCFLDNPGCGIGRDKAMRQKENRKANP